MQKQIINYLSEQQSSKQWVFFLTAFAHELNQEIPAPQLRSLMKRSGMRAAEAMPLSHYDSIQAIQEAANNQWRDLCWGFATFNEQPNYLEIIHCCAPLLSAFGDQALDWAPGFLEGVYQQWFRLLGAGDGLSVRQYGVPVQNGCLTFRFGRHDLMKDQDEMPVAGINNEN